MSEGSTRSTSGSLTVTDGDRVFHVKITLRLDTDQAGSLHLGVRPKVFNSLNGGTGFRLTPELNLLAADFRVPEHPGETLEVALELTIEEAAQLTAQAYENAALMIEGSIIPDEKTRTNLAALLRSCKEHPP